VDKNLDFGFSKAMEQVMGLGREVMHRSTEYYGYGVQELFRTLSMNSYLARQFVEAGVTPTVESLRLIESGITKPLVDALHGKKPLRESMFEVTERATAGVRYAKTVHSLGKKLYGSATFTGETVLMETGPFRLTYIPPTRDTGPQPPMFHVGGFIPFGDLVFRLLPEANLYKPFLERGIGIYAMEQRGRKRSLKGYTLKESLDTLDAMVDAAYEHAGRRKLILEGYCGAGMPMLAYLAKYPQKADARVQVAYTFVAPVDGRPCKLVGGLVTLLPESLLNANFALADLATGYITSTQLRTGIDIPLNTAFIKTRFGYFVEGWKNPKHSNAKSPTDLNTFERRKLAGAYWLSPENCADYPIPVDVARFMLDLWLKGVGDDGVLPAAQDLEPLNLGVIHNQTNIRLAGFYGGQDRTVPESTAKPMKAVFGDRYTHVFHPSVAHIAYAVASEMFDKGSPWAIHPNPIDVVLELYQR